MENIVRSGVYAAGISGSGYGGWGPGEHQYRNNGEKYKRNFEEEYRGALRPPHRASLRLRGKEGEAASEHRRGDSARWGIAADGRSGKPEGKLLQGTGGQAVKW